MRIKSYENLRYTHGGDFTTMIFGYVSKREHPRLESYIEKCDPKGIAFRYRFGEKKAYFFRGDTDLSLCPTYSSSTSLMLCEGIPIRGSPESGYELVDTINDEDIKKGFHNFIDEIVSNVSTIFFKSGNNPKLHLSSSRATFSRIYYRYIKNGIAFSSSFSVLLHFEPSKINYEAIYSILKYGYAPPPLTLSEDIHVVPSSHYVTVDLSKMEVSHHPYFRFCFSEEHGFNLDRLDEILDAISEILDQNSACFLFSGGVDSTILAQKTRERSNKRVKSYFLAFGKNDPELAFAKEASTLSDFQLKVIYMDENRLLEIVDEIATSYDHPFNDISIIPTYYLMKRVADEGEKIIVDGTGGDVCLGYDTLAQDKLWMFTHGLPKALKDLISLIYSRTDIWKKERIIEKIFKTIAKGCETEVNLTTLVNSPSNDIFFSNPNYNETISKLSMSAVDKLIDPCSSRQIFKQRQTVADILFSDAPVCCAKTHLRKRFPKVYTLYPYLWKDVLEEQGKISWSAKVNNGIEKWPLKKLLEPYMPNHFIYRTKMGFDPDLESYIKSQEFYSLLRETFMNPSIVDTLINKNRFVKLIESLPTIKGYSFPLRSLLWGLLFIELWTSKHRRFLRVHT